MELNFAVSRQTNFYRWKILNIANFEIIKQK